MYEPLIRYFTVISVKDVIPWRMVGVEVDGTPELHNFCIGSCKKKKWMQFSMVSRNSCFE